MIRKGEAAAWLLGKNPGLGYHTLMRVVVGEVGNDEGRNGDSAENAA